MSFLRLFGTMPKYEARRIATNVGELPALLRSCKRVEQPLQRASTKSLSQVIASASALSLLLLLGSALFVTIQILLLSTSPTAAITVDLAKKCRDMAIKAHPRSMPGKPYAQAERDFFRQCVAKNGQIEYTDAASVLYEPKMIVRTEDVRTSTLLQMETLNMDRAAPILIRIYKEENTLEVWKQDRAGKFALLGA